MHGDYYSHGDLTARHAGTLCTALVVLAALSPILAPLGEPEPAERPAYCADAPPRSNGCTP